MKVEIINIGDELLIGQVVNTNCSYMSKLLNRNGFLVSRVSVVADDKQAIKDILSEAMQRVDIVLLTGGLGPTKDDITKVCLTEIFGGELKENAAISRHVEHFFASRNLPYTSTNRSQAFIPTSCTPIFNSVGTAPGMLFEKDSKTVISMPGVPFEMQNMMNDIDKNQSGTIDFDEFIEMMTAKMSDKDTPEDFIVKEILDYNLD